jgi:hypothetical protein
MRSRDCELDLPLPFADFRHVLTAFPDIGSVLSKFGVHHLLQLGLHGLQFRDPPEKTLDNMESIQAIEHGHVKGVVVVPLSLNPRT